MKYLTMISMLLLTTLFLFGCQSRITENSDNSGTQTEEEIVISENELDLDVSDSSETYMEPYNEQQDSSDPYREPYDDELNEYGMIAAIEDGAYPMFLVTVEFPERQTEVTFDLNIEAISMDVSELMSLSGKYVSLYYTSELEPFLYDMHYQGKTLLGEYAPEYDASMKQITGILDGAATETYSDLPGKISVTDDEGKRLVFEYYVDGLMVPANGQLVTAFYYMKGSQTITYLKASED